MQVSYIAAFFGVVFMLVALAAWWRLVAQRGGEATEGRPIRDTPRVRSAAMATVIAVGFSSIAAMAVVMSWF